MLYSLLPGDECRHLVANQAKTWIRDQFWADNGSEQLKCKEFVKLDAWPFYATGGESACSNTG